jgi:hypothetical protein
MKYKVVYDCIKYTLYYILAAVTDNSLKKASMDGKTRRSEN